MLACVLALFSVAAVWTDRTLSNTDQYVKTVAPLADDPAVQAALANQITATVMDNVDIDGLVTDALTTLAKQPNVPPRVSAALPGLAVPITNGVESFTRTEVSKILATPQFATVWEQVNRIAHQQIVKLLEGNQTGALSAQAPPAQRLGSRRDGAGGPARDRHRRVPGPATGNLADHPDDRPGSTGGRDP